RPLCTCFVLRMQEGGANKVLRGPGEPRTGLIPAAEAPCLRRRFFVYPAAEPPMFIQTEQTPNPATLKFLPGCTVMSSGTANFTDLGSTARSPLAERLFALPEVTGVFLGADFVTVTKSGDSDWHQLKPAVLAAIMEHFTAGRPVILTEAGAEANAAEDEEDDEVVAQIKELLETRVRPAVAMDGGDIIFHDFEDGV